MRKTIIFLAIIMSINLLTAQEHKEYFDNGNLKEIGKYENDIATGEWKRYHENGQLSEIGKYENGIKKGEWKLYHENGQLFCVGKLKNGKIIGKWVFYDEQGRKTEEIEHNNVGLKHGVNIKYTYQIFTTVVIHTPYINGVKSGIYKGYADDKLLETGEIVNGLRTGVWKNYNFNGQLTDIGNYQKGEKIGEWKNYDKNGELIGSINYKNKKVKFIDNGNDNKTEVKTNTKLDLNEKISFMIIEKPPVFPGCNGNKKEIKDCFSKSIRNHILKEFNQEISNNLGLSSGKKMVLIGFLIDMNGNIVNINARAPHPKIKSEIIRVIKQLPKMKPGNQDGQNRIVKYSISHIIEVK
ncbi:hypothetical protein LPB136_09860 [Tenacibaculum todarodis]|uniref:TonB C-terminal domain-containing protein n=1 Tax=Tenacibaculum todarodis TaxID=1850252 RepID=A0A1L3JKK0_9FLAO|nr:toxin-antitoxin system YwqK family antitoxin [Tenacibaculum todarodis]APG65649.1 hypothetical protein LPB136_09860 [Tenacibaculum todarodis]